MAATHGYRRRPPSGYTQRRRGRTNGKQRKQGPAKASTPVWCPGESATRRPASDEAPRAREENRACTKGSAVTTAPQPGCSATKHRRAAIAAGAVCVARCERGSRGDWPSTPGTQISVLLLDYNIRPCATVVWALAYVCSTVTPHSQPRALPPTTHYCTVQQ